MGVLHCSYLGESTHSFHYSLSSLLLSSRYFGFSLLNIAASVRFGRQVCMYMSVCVCVGAVWAALSLSSEEVICSRGL